MRAFLDLYTSLGTVRAVTTRRIRGDAHRENKGGGGKVHTQFAGDAIQKT